MGILDKLYNYFYNNRTHPFYLLLKFIAITCAAIVIGNLVSVVIIIAIYGKDTLFEVVKLNLYAPHVVNSLWILQILGTTIPIGAAAVYFAYVSAKQPEEYLRLTVKFPWVLMAIVFFVMMISAPLIELLSNINQKMVLPQFLNGLQQWMRAREDEAQKLIAVLLQMKTIWSMIVNVLVIGLFTAVVEEFMFRGCIQTIFTKWTKNVHAAVWITAILFSAFHMEFFGFLPRLMLGVLFGYFVAWSGSIWPAVWAHFINNGAAVVATYFYQQKKTTINPDDQHIFNYYMYLLSLIIILFLLYVYRTVATEKTQRLPEH